mgnify:CR=1 FL=1
MFGLPSPARSPARQLTSCTRACDKLRHRRCCCIIGTLGGTSVPEEDIPRFLDWYKNGDLDLDALVTSRVSLDEINEATKMLEDGKVLGRSIIEF